MRRRKQGTGSEVQEAGRRKQGAGKIRLETQNADPVVSLRSKSTTETRKMPF